MLILKDKILDLAYPRPACKLHLPFSSNASYPWRDNASIMSSDYKFR